MQPELLAQRERLKRLRGRQVEQLELSYANDQRPQQIKEKRRLAKQKRSTSASTTTNVLWPR
jgi:hypothetical protein